VKKVKKPKKPGILGIPKKTMPGERKNRLSLPYQRLINWPGKKKLVFFTIFPLKLPDKNTKKSRSALFFF